MGKGKIKTNETPHPNPLLHRPCQLDNRPDPVGCDDMGGVSGRGVDREGRVK